MNCFTDGSKTDTEAGYSIMGATETRQKCIHLSENTTVYDDEIIAITSASIDMIREDVKNREINFHIDSQSAIK